MLAGWFAARRDALVDEKTEESLSVDSLGHLSAFEI